MYRIGSTLHAAHDSKELGHLDWFLMVDFTYLEKENFHWPVYVYDIG